MPLTSILFENVRICFCLFKDNYLKKEKFILHILFDFWILHQILKISKKKKIVIGYVFLKLQTVKDLLRALTNKRRFRTCFESQHLKGSQHLRNRHDSTFRKFVHRFAKYLLHWNLTSDGCLLTHWLMMTKILFRNVRSCCPLFKGYLKNEKFCLNFPFFFLKLYQILNIFWKRRSS